MDKIKCIAHYYPTHKGTDARNYSPASCAKLEYIFECLIRNGANIHVLSACGNRGGEALKGSIEHLGDGLMVELLPCGARKNKLQKIITVLTFKRLSARRMYDFVNDGDVVLVYHSLHFMKQIEKLKKRKNIRLIMDVEEIYGDVSKNKRVTEKERRYLQIADAFIFPTESLNLKVNQRNLPYVISHGTYSTVPNTSSDLFQDGLIHCVYAGTLDSRKGGAETAIRTAECLPEGYHMHILGFGNPAEVEATCALIDTISKKTACKITYDGVFHGADYLRFLQSCHLGLSTQNPYAEFNDTSFPSKILSYMANGLRVVSVRIPVVEQSKISKYVYYYDTPTPEDIAAAICGVNFSEPYDSRSVIRRLDQAFCADMTDMMEKIDI
jgi:glycosyltransferase involved in cell wall biosynthesis